MSAPTPAPASWSPLARFAFRFFLIYWLLYSLPFPLNQIPDKGNLETLKKHVPWTGSVVDALLVVVEPTAKTVDDYVLTPYREGEHFLVPWVGKNVLKLDNDITYFMSGSGDKTSDYVRNFVVLATAMVGACVWTILGWILFRPSVFSAIEALIFDFLRIYVRFVLGATMLSYGSFKIVPLQMPTPGLDRLMEPVGEMSPMGLCWTFIGASAAYSAFAGVSEALSGVLLLFRRTTTLGALLTIAVMGNVVAMNFCYDVPVKLYSTNLLLMAVFLLAPDLGRLTNVLILNRSAPERDLGPPWKTIRWLYWPLLVLKLLFVGWLLYVTVIVAIWVYQDRDERPRAEIVGIFDVVEFKRNGSIQQPLLTDAKQWRRVIFNELAFRSMGFCSVRQMDDRLIRCTVTYDAKKQLVTLAPRDLNTKDPFSTGSAKVAWTFKVERPDDNTMTLEGEVDGEKLFVKLHLTEAPKFQLLTRPFNWVQEFPYNR